jgi:hypothetical protein
MKILAYFLVLAGIVGVLGAAPALFGGAGRLKAVFALIDGLMALLVGAGILKKKRFAWPLGFAFILMGALYFIAEVVPFALQKQGAERTVILASCVIGSALVCIFWASVWYRQRIYFSAEETDA